MYNCNRIDWSDAAAAKKLEEEDKVRLELAWVEAQREEKEGLDRVRKLGQDRMEIEAVEHELEVKRKALRDTGKDVHNVDMGDNDGDNEGSESAPDLQPVRIIPIYFA